MRGRSWVRLVRSFAQLSSLLALTLGVSQARADFAESDYGDYEPPKPERRSGFTFGLDYGAGYGHIVGYPNKLAQLNDPAYRQTISAAGGGGAFWIGSALRDWISVGLGYAARGAGNKETSGGGGAILFRVEGFPLYMQGPRWRDLGVLAEFGAGSGAIADKDGTQLANAGSMSSVAFGAFYEPLQFWHFSAGPVVRYAYDFSTSWASHNASVGFRLVFYGTQPD